MQVVGVIPSRYASSRFPGKPLADICGHPMIWWVYQNVSKAIPDTVIATDDKRISDVCEQLDIPFVMTSDAHPEHISRIHEVSELKQADFYVCVNGDEPLVDPDSIRAVIDIAKFSDNPVYYGAMRTITCPAHVIDSAKIKLAIGVDSRCVYLSRAPIPHPQGTLVFDYHKYMGIECFNKSALDFFVSTPVGILEKIEDIDHLRFVENGVPLIFTEVASESISVDNPKDLEYVRMIIQKNMQRKE